MRLTGQIVSQGLDQARLANARLADKHNYLALTLFGLLPAVEQQSEFLFAADQGRETCPPQRLKAAFGHAFTSHPPSLYRCRKTPQRVTSQVLKGKHLTDYIPCAVGNNHRSRFCEHFQSDSQIYRPAGRNLSRSAFAELVVHYQASSDT